MFGFSIVKRPVKRSIHHLGYDITKLRGLEQASWIADRKIATVLDIGANIGQFTYAIRKLLPEAQIYAFEPIDECFITLSDRMCDDHRFQCFPYALGSENRTATLNKNNFSPSSSLLPMAESHVAEFSYTKKALKTSAQVRTLDSIASPLNLLEPLLVKVDVQGFESHVIEGGRETMKRADVIIMEIIFAELYEGQPSFDDLYAELHGIGMSFCGVMNQSYSSSNNQPLFCDAIFIKQN